MRLEYKRLSLSKNTHLKIMSLKKLYLICFSILSIASVNAQTKYAKIVVYRIESNTEKTEDQYKIFADDNLTTSLKNNSFEEFYMPEGRFILKVNIENSTSKTIECSKGETYYFKIYRNLNLSTKPITVNSVDSTTAMNEMTGIKKTKTKHYKKSSDSDLTQQNAIGLVFEPIKGFNQLAILNTKIGTTEILSFGGEGAVGLSYSHELTDNYGFLFELESRFSSIFLDNDMAAEFNTGQLSVSPYYSIPIDLKIAQKFKIGLGLDYYFNPILSYYDSDKVLNGFNDEWIYKNVLGYHFLFYIETKLTEKLRVHSGLKYSDVQYTFKSSKTHQPTDVNLKNPRGNSLAVSLGLEYYF